jgi:hypothetical protein
MEPVTTKQHNSEFADLFKPLEPIKGGASASENTTPGSATGPTSEAGTKPSPAVTGAHGVIDEKAATAGLNYTSIPTFSQNAGGSQSGAAPLGTATPDSGSNLGGMVKGEWVVSMMDSILPGLLVAGLYAFNIKLRKTELQLTEKERQTIAPVMQRCLDTILLNFDSPWSQLAITVGVIYGGKVAEKGLIGFMDKKEEKRNTKLNEELKEAALRTDKEANPAKYDTTNTTSANDIATGAVHMPSAEMPFTEEDIKSTQKRYKIGRDKAIARLKKEVRK